MKMTCNGEAPLTLQAAFEINISTLRSRERGRRVAGVSRAEPGTTAPFKGRERSTLDIKTEREREREKQAREYASGVTSVHRVPSFLNKPSHVPLD